MKLSTGLLVVGGLAAAGALVYLVYQKKHAANTDTTDTVDVTRASALPVVLQPETQPEAPKPQMDEVKAEVAASVVERHAAASEAVRGSMESIFSDDDSEVVVTQNTEKLNKIGEDLDDVLK